MSTSSIPAVVMASISFYVGLYHLLIYFRRRQHREDLTFALMCLATGFYAVFCAGLYSATSVAQGVQWQRAQLIALAACRRGSVAPWACNGQITVTSQVGMGVTFTLLLPVGETENVRRAGRRNMISGWSTRSSTDFLLDN